MRQLVLPNASSDSRTTRNAAKSESTLTSVFTTSQPVAIPVEQQKPVGKDTGSALQTQIEQTLAEIWCTVLDLCQVDIHQNFFYLGGDALRSLQVRCLALEKGLNFSLPSFYTHPTIHELAQELVVASV